MLAVTLPPTQDANRASSTEPRMIRTASSPRPVIQFCRSVTGAMASVWLACVCIASQPGKPDGPLANEGAGRCGEEASARFHEQRLGRPADPALPVVEVGEALGRAGVA